MDDLWQRVGRLVGRELPLAGGAGRTVQVLAVETDAVVVRGKR